MTNTHILVNQFDYHEPVSLAEACGLLAQNHGHARVIAGGTDLLVYMKMERTAPGALISLSRIPGLDRIDAVGEQLHLGARATIHDIERCPTIQARYQALSEACASFSSTQVQALGTVGGNLANASPASDSAPALLVFGALIELCGPGVRRRLPLEQFFLGPGESALGAGEIISHIVLPQPAPGSGSAFLKISRVANDIAKASCAVLLVRAGERIVDCRIACGSVAPTPRHAPLAEALLSGRQWCEDLVDEAAALVAQEMAPIDDIRSSGWYRREIVRVMAGDGLRLAWQRAHLAGGHDVAIQPSETEPGQAPGAADATGGAITAGPSSMLPAGERRLIDLRVNGHRRQAWVASHDLLLNVLRDDLELTGTKYGCGIGECSACTVLLDGRPVLACLVLALATAGHDVVTIEGLASSAGQLDPLQEAFIDSAAYQCGYCTPGMLLTARSLLQEKPQPTEDDIRHYLRGNLCRCTGYASIVRAVLAAARQAGRPEVAEPS